MSASPVNAPFGSVLAGQMALSWYREERWSPTEIRPLGPLEIHPAAPVLHYGIECFEGFKAYRHADDSVHVFRMDSHIHRLPQNARALISPEPRTGTCPF